MDGVREVIFGSTLERKICQLHFQAFYKTSRVLNNIKFPISSVWVPQKETSPLATLENGVDEADIVMLIEIALSVMPNMHKTRNWQSAIL